MLRLILISVLTGFGIGLGIAIGLWLVRLPLQIGRQNH